MISRSFLSETAHEYKCALVRDCSMTLVDMRKSVWCTSDIQPLLKPYGQPPNPQRYSIPTETLQQEFILHLINNA